MPVADWLARLGLGASAARRPATARCPHLLWAASGAMALTGPAERPLLAPGPVAAVLDAIDVALRDLTARSGTETGIDPATVLGARAGLRAAERRGRRSVGGATRLLEAADGWVAISLAREDDRSAVPAMFGSLGDGDVWTQLQVAVASRPAAEVVDRVRLFGVPVAAVPAAPPPVEVPWRLHDVAERQPGSALAGALVVDLSALWAGPLCAQVLGRAGARVVKVESVRRPDGARAGDPRFYDWLHAGHDSVAVDLDTADGRAAVAALIRRADVVIEASRPRALTQLGLAHDQLALRPGAVWVSITGHGRERPDLAAFGDDAAAAGGLVADDDGSPVFCGDAIADPLTGVTAALAAIASRVSGGGHLVDLSMTAVAAAFAGAPFSCPGPHPVEQRRSSWSVRCPGSGDEQRVLSPRVPEPTGRAAACGADNARWSTTLAV